MKNKGVDIEKIAETLVLAAEREDVLLDKVASLEKEILTLKKEKSVIPISEDPAEDAFFQKTASEDNEHNLDMGSVDPYTSDDSLEPTGSKRLMAWLENM